MITKYLRFFIVALVLYFPALAVAQDPLADLLGEQQQFLPVEEAFQFEFRQQDGKLHLSWQVAEGYYLYKKQFKTALTDVNLSTPRYAPEQGEEIEDEYFGVSEVYFEDVSIEYDIHSSAQDGVVKIRYQGCAEAGLCYPATTQVVYLDQVSDSADGSEAAAAEQEPEAGSRSEQFELADLLSSDQHLLWTLLIFVVLGAGLALTPCVFPMYPILSGIIIGQGKEIKTSKAFSLSFIYVQGMAITYSLLGLVVASAGVKFQAALQHPAILITFIVVFSLLALVMFGAWELQLPAKWQEKLNNVSNQQKGGRYSGVFLMGAISGLVASPCTTAPLTGILLFVAQSGDLVLGFSALYALSIGMGIPLVLFGMTGGKLLPKAGAWMNIVKVTFGFMMLAVALLFVERMFDNQWTDLAWAILGLSTFSYWQVMNQGTATSFFKGIRSLIIFLGLFGSALYGYQAVLPGVGLVQSGKVSDAENEVTKGEEVHFMRVRDLGDFAAKLQAANAQGKSVMIDLYADWCVACKEFEKYTFPDERVKKALENTVLMQIDLTENTPTSLAFQEEFAVLGLPTILFFDAKGNELQRARVTGFMNAERFAAHLEKLPL
ncbi:protein-disulfide reductase DsbD [Lacimicrobium alkaliphilum]|uniref:Thiol:disulfide interchange protein DsbD n=1 Tax=Lacimicrobium alkaliphilum TaxID=1526571 RepID=A0ABQ1RGY0_9ALTE|nr:protein-disulfide reductase DsbD [Lacimicrobium alkaliphilum]GGD70115.1 thiol:disulfide interchange protein DsbD [Lacimicrobium alkaliphilum]